MKKMMTKRKKKATAKKKLSRTRRIEVKPQYPKPDTQVSGLVLG